MRLHRRRTVIAVVAALTVLGAPLAVAHSPRDHRPGAPVMDLEVLVTPVITGRTTPGGTDAVVSVDGFGNRFAMARKETTQQVIGVDQRARAMVRTAPWAWSSVDDGTSWNNLELLPRGVDAFLPEGDFALASAGATTFVAATTPAGVALTTITATKRGRFAAATPTVIAAPPGVDGVVQLAAFPGGGLLLVGLPVGARLYSVQAGVAKQVATLAGATGCDLAASGRSGRAVGFVACLEGSQITRSVIDLGTAKTTRTVLGSADSRGGGTGQPSVDIAPDGSSFVLSGTRMWRTLPIGRTTVQDVRSEGGDHRVTALAVSHKGRVGIAAYRKGAGGTWNVVVTVFTPGAKPIWSDFAFHDPVSPRGASGPPSDVVTVDFDEKGRVQVLWTATLLQREELDRPLLRNIWAVRSTTT